MKKFIYPLLFFFILFHSLFLCVNAVAFTEQEVISKGIKLFKSGLFQQSYNVLMDAFDQYPANPELNFYLGRAAFEIGNYEMAIMAFERILIISPSESRVKLEMARTFQKLGANDIARKYCNEVLMTNPPAGVKENIKKFLTYLDKTEQNQFFSGTLSVGVDWNNNVWASPSIGSINTIIGDINLTGPSAKKTQDWVYNTTLSADYIYRFSYSKNAWKTRLNLYKARYDTAQELNLRYFGLETGPEFILDKNRLWVSALINDVELDNEQYLETGGLKTEWSHIFNPGLISNTAFKYEYKNYPDLPNKDADNFSLAGGLSFLKKNIWFNIGVRAEKEYALEDEFTYTRYASNLSASRALPFGINASVQYEYQNTKYKAANNLFTQIRKDEQHLAGCTANKKIWQAKESNQYITMNLNYLHRWAFSNIELYDYTMDLMQLSLIYNF